MPGEYEQIPFTHIDGIRKALDDKIDSSNKELNASLNSKLSHTVFFSILGILLSITVSILGYLGYQIGTLQEKLSRIDKDVVLVKTRQDDMQQIRHALAKEI